MKRKRIRKDWEDLVFWDSGEHQVIQERLDDLDRAGKLYNPRRELVYAALDSVDFDATKVMVVGQDPYPDRDLATGLAFSIPSDASFIPPTLKTILKEYSEDLHYPTPSSGDLSPWTKEGVLLWNVYPTCLTGQSMSHKWVEWEDLTNQIIQKLSTRGRCVFVFLGSVARPFGRQIELCNNSVIDLGHPSPRGNMSARKPFTGSRMFTLVNAELVRLGQNPVDWRLE